MFSSLSKKEDNNAEPINKEKTFFNSSSSSSFNNNHNSCSSSSSISNPGPASSSSSSTPSSKSSTTTAPMMNFAPTPIIPAPYHFPSFPSMASAINPMPNSAFQPFTQFSSFNHFKTDPPLPSLSFPSTNATTLPTTASATPLIIPASINSQQSAAAASALFPFNSLMLSSMGRQISDYQTLQQLLMENIKFAPPSNYMPVIPKVEVPSPISFQQIPPPSTVTTSSPPFTSIETPTPAATMIPSISSLMDLQKSLQVSSGKVIRRRSFPQKDAHHNHQHHHLHHHTSSKCSSSAAAAGAMYDGMASEMEDEMLFPSVDDAIITEKSRMLIVSAATLTKLYGTKQYRSSATNSPVVEGNIRKGDLKCVVCQDKAATGRHYGVVSCFGCKSFWRRSIWHNRKYRCKFNGDCPIRRLYRNICRACRLRRCFNVGMNPFAVQSERESGKMLKDAPSEKSDEELDISRADSVSSFSAPILSASTSCSNRTTQTDGLFSDGTIHCDDDALKKGQVLVSIHQAVCSRFDEISMDTSFSSSSNSNNPLSPTSINLINSSQIDIIGGPGPSTPSKLSRPFENVSFCDAFYNPSLIFSRTPLNPIGDRQACIRDILEDWRRVFVLYSDWLLQLPEFRQLSKEDRIIVAQHRFSTFHWWICGIWTLDAQKDGVCYSNGSYFPKNEGDQCIPDPQNVTTKLLTHFVEPLKDLNLSDVEKCALFVIALFNDDLPISPKGREQIRKFCEKYTRVIFNTAVLDTIKTLGAPVDNPFVYSRVHTIAANRLGRISILAGKLASQSVSVNHGILSDTLHIVNWNPEAAS